MSSIPDKIRNLMGQWFLANFCMIIVTMIVCCIPYVALVACPVMFIITIPITNFVFFWKYVELSGKSEKVKNRQTQFFNPDNWVMENFKNPEMKVNGQFMGIPFDWSSKNNTKKDNKFFLFGPMVDPWIEPWVNNDLWKPWLDPWVQDTSDDTQKNMDMWNKMSGTDQMNQINSTATLNPPQITNSDPEYNKMKHIINQNTEKIKQIEEDQEELDEELEEELDEELKEELNEKQKTETTKSPSSSSKRSRIGLIIGIIMFILLLGALIAGIVIMQKKNIMPARQLLS